MQWLELPVCCETGSPGPLELVWMSDSTKVLMLRRQETVQYASVKLKCFSNTTHCSIVSLTTETNKPCALKNDNYSNNNYKVLVIAPNLREFRSSHQL